MMTRIQSTLHICTPLGNELERAYMEGRMYVQVCSIHVFTLMNVTYACQGEKNYVNKHVVNF